MYQSPDSGRQYDLLFPPYPRSSDTRRRGLLNLSGGLCSCVVGVSVPLDKFSWPKPRCLSCHLLSFLPHLLNPTLHVRSMSPFAIAWAQLPALVSCADVGLGSQPNLVSMQVEHEASQVWILLLPDFPAFLTAKKSLIRLGRLMMWRRRRNAIITSL